MKGTDLRASRGVGPGNLQDLREKKNERKLILTLRVQRGNIPETSRESNCLRQSGRWAEGSKRHIAMKRMRILLQQKDTGMYFQNVGTWVPDGSEAMDFVSSTAAIDFCSANKLAGVQLVLKFTDEKCDIVMPVVAAEAAHSRSHRPSQIR
jgi:hypothetical protein